MVPTHVTDPSETAGKPVPHRGAGFTAVQLLITISSKEAKVTSGGAKSYSNVIKKGPS